jgi:hypothetical protein
MSETHEAPVPFLLPRLRYTLNKQPFCLDRLNMHLGYTLHKQPSFNASWTCVRHVAHSAGGTVQQVRGVKKQNTQRHTHDVSQRMIIPGQPKLFTSLILTFNVQFVTGCT